jgi:hypothetical protein
VQVGTASAPAFGSEDPPEAFPPAPAPSPSPKSFWALLRMVRTEARRLWWGLALQATIILAGYLGSYGYMSTLRTCKAKPNAVFG